MLPVCQGFGSAIADCDFAFVKFQINPPSLRLLALYADQKFPSGLQVARAALPRIGKKTSSFDLGLDTATGSCALMPMASNAHKPMFHAAYPD